MVITGSRDAGIYLNLFGSDNVRARRIEALPAGLRAKWQSRTGDVTERKSISARSWQKSYGQISTIVAVSRGASLAHLASVILILGQANRQILYGGYALSHRFRDPSGAVLKKNNARRSNFSLS